ncbi:MAG: Maf family protein [Candidatus Hodarchaeales archaeon]
MDSHQQPAFLGSQQKLILCSKSTGRAAILEAANINFEVSFVSINEERQPGETPIGLVRRLAYCKALPIAKKEAPYVAIGADTVVLNEQQKILGKPQNRNQAIEMLQELSGCIHQVLTGIALIYNDNNDFRTVQGHNFTTVKLKKLRMTQISSYVDNCASLDRAGGYAIQCGGEKIIAGIEGCWTNVVGLPFGLLGALYLAQTGKPLLERISKASPHNPADTCIRECSSTAGYSRLADCPFSSIP